MNRKSRRNAEKKGQRDSFDPMQHFKITYDMHIPPGLMRSAHPSRVAGTIEATSESDAMRGLFVALMNAAGLSADQRAVVGTLAEMINPFSNPMRGGLAYAVIHGQGLEITEVDVKVCDECKAEYTESLGDLTALPDDPDEAAAAIALLMHDTTQHELACSSSNKQRCFAEDCVPGDSCEICGGEGLIPKTPADPVYTETKAVQILLPRKYAGINDEAEKDGIPRASAQPMTADLDKELVLEEGETIPSDDTVEVSDGDATA